jgi:predicted nucleic acid-binding Zn ribbon protein
MSRDDLPLSLHDALEELTADLRVAGPDVTAVIEGIWPTLVGRELAPHVRLGSLRDRALTLVVDDPAWATPLRYLESDIVATLAARLGPGVVETVRIAVSRR